MLSLSLSVSLKLNSETFFLRTNAGMHGNILDFTARLDISIDVAHAVTYLHMYTGLFYVEMGKCNFLFLYCEQQTKSHFVMLFRLARNGNMSETFPK